MRYRYILDEEGYSYLQEWTDANMDRTIYCPMFGKKAEIILKDYDMTFYVEEKRNGDCKYRITDSDGTLAKGVITRDSSYDHDFMLEVDLAEKIRIMPDDVHETFMKFVRLYAGAFKMINCFMFYGNLTANKEFTAAGRNDGQIKIITLRKFKDTIYAVPVGSHRSPEGVFSVRGHFRHYQDGKVIWIDEYLKGVN